jgi:hypothetical protein
MENLIDVAEHVLRIKPHNTSVNGWEGVHGTKILDAPSGRWRIL